MRKIILILLSIIMTSCATQQILKGNEKPQLNNFSFHSGHLELTSRYSLKYRMDLSFDTKEIHVLWNTAEVIDKETNDTVNVKMENVRCALISNPPTIYAGVFEFSHQGQHYIVHFLQDFRTYVNKKKGTLESTEKLYNTADLDPEIFERFPMK
ncbi:hypothetical protein [Prevotella sp. E2-28]|uniref:hypothetical protein n=1 Tax=Prevotella sp. E2-28 TaxID=2913620 RepID=UPI001EDBC689|nr:hypothetical protein [Prevotella sp. E2-28]UKK53725.1 hypothetical protein L6465_00185 [Prevotella sp. E2-28]